MFDLVVGGGKRGSPRQMRRGGWSIRIVAKRVLTCFLFAPSVGRPSFSGHLFAPLSPSKSALFCRAKGTAQSLERGSFRIDLSTKIGKEVPSRNVQICVKKGQGVFQQVLNPTPLNPTPATCHKRKRKSRCSFGSAALQKLRCNIRFSAVRKSFGPKAALQQPLQHRKSCVAGKWRFPAAFLRVSSPHV